MGSTVYEELARDIGDTGRDQSSGMDWTTRVLFAMIKMKGYVNNRQSAEARVLHLELDQHELPESSRSASHSFPGCMRRATRSCSHDAQQHMTSLLEAVRRQN